MTIQQLPAATFAGPAAPVVPLEFQRFGFGGTSMQEGGVVSYFQAGSRGAVQVSMTWDSLALLCAALERRGEDVDEEVVLTLVLTQWACEQVERRSRIRRARLPGPLVLDFARKPSGREPDRLLERAGLIAVRARQPVASLSSPAQPEHAAARLRREIVAGRPSAA